VHFISINIRTAKFILLFIEANSSIVSVRPIAANACFFLLWLLHTKFPQSLQQAPTTFRSCCVHDADTERSFPGFGNSNCTRVTSVLLYSRGVKSRPVAGMMYTVQNKTDTRVIEWDYTIKSTNWRNFLLRDPFNRHFCLGSGRRCEQKRFGRTKNNATPNKGCW